MSTAHLQCLLSACETQPKHANSHSELNWLASVPVLPSFVQGSRDFPMEPSATLSFSAWSTLSLTCHSSHPTCSLRSCHDPLLDHASQQQSQGMHPSGTWKPIFSRLLESPTLLSNFHRPYVWLPVESETINYTPFCLCTSRKQKLFLSLWGFFLIFLSW